MSRSALKLKKNSIAEEKVNLAINMIDTCVRICADAVRERYPRMKEEELLERVRERIIYCRHRWREV